MGVTTLPASGWPRPEAGQSATPQDIVEFPLRPPPLDRLSDDALMDRVKADDQTAFRTLVERHLDRAYAVALRVVGNRADAEEIAQEAFMTLWRTRERWEPGRAQVGTWLYRVVVNRCTDLLRRGRDSGLDEVPEPADPADSAVAIIHRGELTRLLESALDRLPGQQRTAVVLFYFEDLSNAEIAAIMGTTVGAVESLLKRARQRLRTLLHGRQDGLADGGPLFLD